MSALLLKQLLPQRALLRGVGMLGAAQVVTSLLGIATTVMWARFMPVELFGEFRVVLSIATFVAAFCLLGTGQAATMSAAQGKDGNFWPLLRAKLWANLLGAGGLLGAASYYAWHPDGSAALSLGLLVAALCFPLYNASELWMAWINGAGRLGGLALGRIVNSALGLLAVVLAAVLRLDLLWQVLALVLVAQAVQNMAMLWSVWRRRRNSDEDQSIRAYGQHATIAMAFGSLLSLDMVLLNHVHDARAVAIYVLALQLPEQLKALYGVFGQALAPRIQAAATPAAAWLAMRRSFWAIAGGMALLGVIGYFLLPPVMLLLFSERYAEAASHARWLWLTLAFTGATSYLGSALLLTKKPIFVYMPYVGFALVTLALYALLVPLGVQGMILARIGAIAALAVFYVVGFMLYVSAAPEAAHG